jgi:hypothetical protein
MNRSPVAATNKAGWSLTVARGRDLGRVYTLCAGETLLGNALGGQAGLELLDQEGDSPRRMAARHAALQSTDSELTIRDLESPGGTFVNRQRLLSGQTRRLQPGDVIQLGSVQLEVLRSGAAGSPSNTPSVPPVSKARAQAPPNTPGPRPSSAVPGRLSVPFTMAGGAVCKSWDDFLVLAAQRWEALRDELSSGRIADHLRRIGRPELVPRWEKGRSIDDQLDEWLGRLPATRANAPEIDVYPEKLSVRAVPGGGITRHTLRLTNVGYRLLRWTARVEPAAASWVRLRAEHAAGPVCTIDQTELSFELEIPEKVAAPLAASIVLESNGGTKRVAVRIEPPTEAVVMPEAGPVLPSEIPLWGENLSRRIAEVPTVTRVLAGCALAIGSRVVVGLVSLLPVGAEGARPLQSRLAALALLLIGAGAVAGVALARKRGERSDLPAAGFAGGALGLLLAAVCHALVQSLERALGSSSGSIWAVGLLWGAIGALLGLLTMLFAPYRPDAQEVAG